LLPPATSPAETSSPARPVPTRPFGKTGESVSILSLGGTIDMLSNQLLLKQAIRWGVTYWDTAHSYGGGRSEEGIGKYLRKYPEDRKKIFLVTKSGAWSRRGLSGDLDRSLERVQAGHIDLFLVHSVSAIDALDDDTRKWSEKAKASGKIRFFGFSTHSNMEECLLGASKLGWIDGIMMTYNYRLMHRDQMRRAVDACAEAGIGLTAMKSQGGGSVRTDSPSELQLAGHFLRKGFTDAQARLKAVWENRQVASICSRMPNMAILSANVAAALDRLELSQTDHALLQAYAAESAAGYCAGCTRLCESALDRRLPIGDVMRCLMYVRSHGDRQQALETYRSIPHDLRRMLAQADFSAAEQRCPQKMPVGRLVREALDEFV
jgi:predicted aldo/keto reductase-like oxidoreductase